MVNAHELVPWNPDRKVSSEKLSDTGSGAPSEPAFDGYQRTVLDDLEFLIPGKGRKLTKEQIAAEYGAKSVRPIPAGYRRQRSAIERILSNTEFRGVVWKVHDSGSREFKSAHLTVEIAENEAGRLRDEMTDDECGGTFTYLASERGKKFHQKIKMTPRKAT